MAINVDAVIVTYNRKDKLGRALDCYDKQVTPFRNLIVVDNCSTDGTVFLLNEWKSRPAPYGKFVLSLDSNKGGSGGFYEGERFALELGADWIYISDDDAYPAEDLVQKFIAFYSGHQEERISAICSSVCDMSKSLIPGCRGFFHVDENGFSLKAPSIDLYEQPFFTCNCLSYVGVFLSAQALHMIGLVNKDYFIYQDDVEHSIRLSNAGTIYCIPNMIVVHDSLPLAQTSQDDIYASIWKEYYAIRNRTHMLLQHFPDAGKKHILNSLVSLKAHKDSSLSSVNKMWLEGIKDACLGKLGLHPYYRPGKKIDSNKGLPYPRLLWILVFYILRLRSLIIK